MDCLSNLIEEECNTQQNDLLFDIWTSFFDHSPVPVNFSADLVFVPLRYNNHYYAVCFNHISKKIEVLDNTSHKDWDHSNFYKLVKALSGPLSDFLDTKGRQIGVDACLFDEIESVAFNWQGPDPLDTESGCFMMMMMLFYEGGSFECDLGSKKSRRTFLAEMAAALVLSDVNLCRERIITRALELQSTKKALFPLLRIERRRQENDLKQKVVKRKRKLPSEITEPQPLTTEIPVARNQHGACTTVALSPKAQRHKMTVKVRGPGICT